MTDRDKHAKVQAQLQETHMTNENDTFNVLKSCSYEEIDKHIIDTIIKFNILSEADAANHHEILNTLKRYGWTLEQYRKASPPPKPFNIRKALIDHYTKELTK